MTKITWTTHDGDKGHVEWPSAGLIRAWLVMLFLDLLTPPLPLTFGLSFWVCWALVNLVRIFIAITREAFR